MDYTLAVGVRKLTSDTPVSVVDIVSFTRQQSRIIDVQLEAEDGSSLMLGAGRAVSKRHGNETVSGLVSRTGLPSVDSGGNPLGNEVYLVAIRFPFRLGRTQSSW